MAGKLNGVKVGSLMDVHKWAVAAKQYEKLRTLRLAIPT